MRISVKMACDRPAIECGCLECCAFIAAIRRRERAPRQSYDPTVSEEEVALAMAEERPYTMTRGSILETVRRLTLAGESAVRIATCLRIEPRTVHRYRKLLRGEGRLP